MFSRTSKGIENERLFYDVDFVVYCEGKTVEGEASSLDEAFWSKIFTEFGIRAHCKSYGGKSALRPLAKKVSGENLQNIIVAMDRDYDDLLGDLIEHPRVIYTYGYSWESDVISTFQAEAALSLFASSTISANIVEELLQFRAKQAESLKRPFALDFKYYRHSLPLFDRNKPMSIIRFSTNGEPAINSRKILDSAKNIKNFQSGTLNSDVMNEPCGIRRFYGKAVARLLYQWFIFRTKRMTGARRVPYDSFMGLISATLSLNDTDIPRNAYYHEIMDAI